MQKMAKIPEFLWKKNIKFLLNYQHICLSRFHQTVPETKISSEQTPRNLFLSKNLAKISGKIEKSLFLLQVCARVALSASHFFKKFENAARESVRIGETQTHPLNCFSAQSAFIGTFLASIN